MNSALKQTPLVTEHEALGARMMEFGGWWMPVQYGGILQEHQAVRTQAGLFDISHMGEIWVSGEAAETFLNRMLTNDVRLLDEGSGQYSLLLNERGGVIDDLLCYRTAAQEYLLVVNASMIEADERWLRAHAEQGVRIENASELWAGFAIQGPQSATIVSATLGLPPEALPSRNGIGLVQSENGTLWLARTGYTGEDGFEFFCGSESGVWWWRRFLEMGASRGLIPCGLGARDTLRLEMGYPLNGSDLSPEKTPLEAGLGAFVKMEKGDFVGLGALKSQKAAGLGFRLYGLVMEGKTPPLRAHYPVLARGENVGETTSGAPSPSLGVGIGMAYLPAEGCPPGTRVEVDIRGRRFPAIVSKRPMYQPHRP